MSAEVDCGLYCHRWSNWQVKLINSIAQHTKSHQYAIHVVQKRGNCHVNMGRLLRRFTAPYCVIMDEDALVLQDRWLDGLIWALEKDQTLGLVGCKDVKHEEEILRVQEPGQFTIRDTPWIPGFLMAFKRERVEFLRPDEAIPGDMGMTDVDLCAQVRSQGLRVAVVPEIIVYHPARDDDETRRIEERPTLARQEEWFPLQQAYMREKWGDLFRRMTGR